MAAIHPAQCCEYNDWMWALFAVRNHVGGSGNIDVHEVLDAFSGIRGGYKGANDVRSKYKNQPRETSQSTAPKHLSQTSCISQTPRITIGTLVLLGEGISCVSLEVRADAGRVCRGTGRRKQKSLHSAWTGAKGAGGG